MHTMLFFELDRPPTFADIIVSASLDKGLRREAASKLELSMQTYDSRHMLFNHQPAPSRLKSRRSFLHCVKPLKKKISTCIEETWKRKLKALPQSTRLNITPVESCPQDQTQDGQCDDVSTAIAQALLELKLS